MLKNKSILKNTILFLSFSTLFNYNCFAQEQIQEMSQEQQMQMQQQMQLQEQMRQQQLQEQMQQQQLMQLQQKSNSQMSLREALQLESQITRSKLQQQLNKELRKEIGDQQKAANQQPIIMQDNKPVVKTAPSIASEPVLKAIRGLPGNLKAYIAVNGATAIGKKGDIVAGWKIISITDSYIILQKKSVKKKLSFYN